MDTNYNRIKVSDLETNEPSKILITNENGEIEFKDFDILALESGKFRKENFEFTGSKIFSLSQPALNVLSVVVDGITLNGASGAPLQYRMNNPTSLEILDEMILGEDIWVSITYNYTGSATEGSQNLDQTLSNGDIATGKQIILQGFLPTEFTAISPNSLSLGSLSLDYIMYMNPNGVASLYHDQNKGLFLKKSGLNFLSYRGGTEGAYDSTIIPNINSIGTSTLKMPLMIDGDDKIIASLDDLTLQKILEGSNRTNLPIIFENHNQSSVFSEGGFNLYRAEGNFGLSTDVQRWYTDDGTKANALYFKKLTNGKALFKFPEKETGDYTLTTTSDFKTINGESIIGDGNIDFSNKQDISNQINVTLPATVQDTWHGKTVKFTGTGTLTIPNSFINSGMCFEGITKIGASLSWSITSPKTFEFGTPPTVGEKQIFTFMQNEGQHSIMILGL